MHFEEFSVRQTNDASRFATVKNDLAVFALQGESDALGHPEGQHRADDKQNLHGEQHVVQRNHEVGCDQVCRCTSPEHRIEGHSSYSDSSANRSVSWSV